MLPSEKLAELGLELPAVATPVAAYVPAVIDRGVVRTSGQIPVVNGEPVCIGAVGEDGAFRSGNSLVYPSTSLLVYESCLPVYDNSFPSTQTALASGGRCRAPLRRGGQRARPLARR